MSDGTSGKANSPVESRDRRSHRLPASIVHVHIPKTAGTSLREAFEAAYGDRLRVYPLRFESEYGNIAYPEFNFFGGHIGFKVASGIGGDLITVLRDPVDRFVSNYFFLRHQSISGEARNHKTFLAERYDLDQFVQIGDEPILQKELRNRMTWQIAYSHRLELRQELIDAGIDDGELVRLALANLETFAVVGIQSDMPGLAEAIRRRYGVNLAIGRANVTGNRLAKRDISPATLRHIERWVYLDEEFYRTWIGMRQAMRVSLGGEVSG